MEFSYEAYRNLIGLLEEKKYEFSSYHDWREKKKVVILRHDIDNSIEDAVRLSEIEKELGVMSTYFVLLRTDMYNVASKYSYKMIEKIVDNGGEIGLHFDEKSYDEDVDVVEAIRKEADILSEIIGRKIKTVSMHRPSPKTLDMNYEIDSIVNSYSDTYFREFKYLSDSRMHWREDILGIINSDEKYDKLHILTHAFWYHKKELSAHDIIKKDFARRRQFLWDVYDSNVRDLSEIITREELIE